MKHSDVLKSRIESLVRISFYQALLFGCGLGYILLAWQTNMPFNLGLTAAPIVLLCFALILEISYRRKKEELLEMID